MKTLSLKTTYLKSLKNVILFIVGLIFLNSCTTSKKEILLFSDEIVQSLNTNNSGNDNITKTTSDGIYSVTQIGRLINIKILNEENKDDYNDLKNDIEQYYKNNEKVYKVYLSKTGTIIIDCSPSKNELFKITDEFVKSLETTYESYGLFGGNEYAKTTNDNLYRVSPIGRLINIKIQEVVNDIEYEELRKQCEDYYINNKSVNKVYICQAGTIMIDCRN